MPEWLGKTIGKVRIEKLLARGGTAEVYLGTHLTLERPVTVKVLHSFIEEETILLERFHREARVVAGLRHPNIVQIFDFDTIDGHPYIVMEYLRGPTLATYLRHQHQRKKRIPYDQVARLLKELSAALDYAHGQGVVHRDIKPSNILLHKKREEIPLDKPLTNDVEVIVTDFGLVRVVGVGSQTASGFLSGTPAYMSPEQARGDPIDHRTDIYSLGVVLYEMLAGRVPFESDNTVTIHHMQIYTTPPPIPGIPGKTQALMDRALAKNPDDRYQTSQEMTIDFYRSIGMTAQAETIREHYPVSPAPVEVPAPEEPAPTEPLPKPAPIAPEPELKPRPAPAELEPAPKPKPVPPEPAPPPKPSGSRVWIGVGLVSLVLLSLVAWWFGGGRQTPKPTETLPPTANANIPLASETPGPPDHTNMVQIPAGTYEVGTTEITDDYHVAPQKIHLDSFWIDHYQTTNAEYQQYLLASIGVPTPVVWPAASGEEKHPVRGVTWDQANAYCSWKNKRLPTEAQWEATGRGPGTAPRLYPWGQSPPEGRLSQPNTYEVGTISFNVTSPWKVYDMVGNVWEWVGEPYYASVEAGKKLLRAGRFSDPKDLAYRQPVAPNDPTYVEKAGFRCAVDEVR